MKLLINRSKVFVIFFALWLIVGAVMLFFQEKGDMVLYFNENRMSLLNSYMVLASKFAEWSFILFFLVVLANKKLGNAFILAFTWALTGIFAQSLKRLFLSPRPAGYFDEKILNFIGDGKLHYHHSFPSGHTTTAFAIFLVLALFTENKFWQLLFFIMAFSVAISRVYLLQHFYKDVYFGSILGFLIGFGVYLLWNGSNHLGFQKWKDKKIGRRSMF